MYDEQLEDILRYGSLSDGNEITQAASSGNQDPPPPDQKPPKKKPYQRHTQLQIQELEAFFKDCPHPEDKQRKELAQRLSLEPLQIKFWFQNKRTQLKAQNDRHENSQLTAENRKLRADNMKYRQALLTNTTTCLTCCRPPTAIISNMSLEEQQHQQLRIENIRLRKEIDLLRLLYGPTQANKPLIIELAVSAMEELMGMAQAGLPLWMPSKPDNTSTTETLNQEQYLRTFPQLIGPTPLGMKSEASRDSAVVIMSHINLVQILMDVDQWMSVFPGIVSTATTLEVLSAGVAGTYNGALQVMTAEFQVPSPLVPIREHYFARYCKQHPNGTWAVVDVSLHKLCPNIIAGSCRRRPSGCWIQELPNGYSKVMWVEHVEVDDRDVHSLYKPLVDSGLGFGAKRWVVTLDRQCERLAGTLSSNITEGEFGLITTPEGRKSMLKLSERMVMGFCTGVSASTAHTWAKISGGCNDVRVMIRKSVDEPGKPPGIVLSAATSLWLPVPPKKVFDFLRDKNSRSQWDILSNGGIVQEMVRIANGRDPGNSVSLLRVNSSNSSQSNMLILQESITDALGSYVISAPVDIFAMNVVLSGENPDYVAFLPSGFAILPDVCSGGSLLTVAFQILVDSVPTAKLSLGSVATVNSLTKCTVERIRSSVCSDNEF